MLLAALRKQKPGLVEPVDVFAKKERGTLIAGAQRRLRQPRHAGLVLLRR